MVFKRYELKYLITTEQYEKMKIAMVGHMALDKYGRHTIKNIYMDTPDHLLIRRSIEKPCYKEKLRIRSYSNCDDNSAFVEVKKKYKGVVYKRRINLTKDEAIEVMVNGEDFHDKNQITREIKYFMDYYKDLHPAISIFYDREAYFGLEDGSFRMTFDQNIRTNDHEFSLDSLSEYDQLISKDRVLLEVKTSMGLPHWLLEFFSENHILKTSFSKYGTAYKKMCFENNRRQTVCQ